ncbi:hypothetical protein [Clostridium tepidum]|jgi:hypothetical protein|uniref:Transposase n=1 Tax=Clostridium tepidum TaxID=1962263 RepID=A0ABX3L382_9CLOT|nr:hypothetical protein [Clostridium tepidum]OOO62025.1 hypothetical protein BS637_09490 [Clostridium tepidum]
MIKETVIDGDYIIYVYESGATMRVKQGDEPKEVIPELPKNPILELQKENESLKKQLDDTQKSIAEMMNLIAMQGITP